MNRNKKKLLALFGISLVLALSLYGKFQLTGADEREKRPLSEKAAGESRVPGETVWIYENAYYVVPEDNFDPLTASDEDLKKYGFPERPDDPEGLEKWRKLYVHRPIWVEPKVYTPEGGLTHMPMQPYEETEWSVKPGKHWLKENTYYIKPPKNFDPLTASDEDLKEYGFPERPNDPEGLAFWESLYEPHPVFVDPEIEEGDMPLTSLPEMLSGSVKAKYSNNWSGVINSGTAYGANGIITVPSVSTTSIYKPAHCASWIGIGGTTTNEALAQLGCDGHINADGSVQYQTFYQTIGTSASSIPQYITAPSISPGDNLFVSVWLEYLSSGAIDIHYYFHNTTKNLFANVVESNVTSYTGITNSAEWIVERPVFGGLITYLAKPMTSSQTKVYFSSCSYKTAPNISTWNNNPSGTVCNMKNALTGHDLASGSSFSSGAMNISWLNYN
ncbi:MAG: hypothetical protein IJL98_04360 [Lachnospiraceae bacterium]|nr:hypothetical protein [Lachnospiraceae bacterium]